MLVALVVGVVEVVGVVLGVVIGVLVPDVVGVVLGVVIGVVVPDVVGDVVTVLVGEVVGVDIGEVFVWVRVLPLQGMRREPSTGATTKLFGHYSEAAGVPLQLTMSSSPAPDPRFIEKGAEPNGW